MNKQSKPETGAAQVEQPIPAGVNAQLSFGHCFWEEATGRYLPHGVSVLTLRETRIADITTFLDPGDFERLALPARLRPAAG